MKNKLIIALAVVTIGLAGYLFGHQWLNRTGQSEIQTFLESFAYNLQNKPADSTAALFDVKQRKKDVLRIISILAGKTAVNGKSKPLFTLALDVNNAEIKVLTETLAEVKVPLKLTFEGLPDFQSSFNFTLQKQSKSRFKIIAFNGEALFTDFVAYENAIRSVIHSDKDIYSPQTLHAFNIAEKLKSKYDTVIWFSYVDHKPFFYVADGQWELENVYKKPDEPAPYQMGLVDAASKEIIPAKFDLIHNIGATFDGMIEVEKDGKRGFYTLQGENIVPVEYEQIIPVTTPGKAAVLSKDNAYYWLNQDFSISERDTSIKIADVLPQTYQYKNTFNISEDNVKHLIEFNSREQHAALYIPPSYLVDWKIIDKLKQFKNPLRRNVEFYDISASVQVKYSTNARADNWLEAAIYSIRDNYIGGRSDFYTSKSVMMVDHKNNRVYSLAIGDEADGQEQCNTFEIKALTDKVVEIKNNGFIYLSIAGKELTEVPVYHYVEINDQKADELPSKRIFKFTKFVRMNDSYLNGCYVYDDKRLQKLNKDILTYMKMEIYADYNYSFPDVKWIDQFKDNLEGYEPTQSNVDGQLSEIDRYNINFLDKKISEASNNNLAALR